MSTQLERLKMNCAYYARVASKKWYVNGQNYCAKFVGAMIVEAQIVKNYIAVGTAAKARAKYMKSGTNNATPPEGAAVFFQGTGAAGHVGIYIGNDKFVHAAGKSGVKYQKFSTYKTKSGAHKYLGWGWYYGVKPTGATVTGKNYNSGKVSSGDKLQSLSSVTGSGSSSTKSTSSTSSYTKQSGKVTGTSEDGSTSIISDDDSAAAVNTELNRTTVVSTSGESGAERKYVSVSTTDKPYELVIYTYEGVAFQPVVEDGIKWTTERKGAASSLTFTVLKEGSLNFHEGDTVIFKVNGTGVFYGFVFKKHRNKGSRIEVTAYDQLRYFKNKHTYIYENKTAGEVLKMIAAEFKLRTGDIEDTKYSIEKRIEDNQTLFDIMQNAIDATLLGTGNLYMLWDDFGSLRLSKVANQLVTTLITTDTAEDFDYTSSIEDSYNKIIVYSDTSTTDGTSTDIGTGTSSAAATSDTAVTGGTTGFIPLANMAKIIMNNFAIQGVKANLAVACALMAGFKNESCNYGSQYGASAKDAFKPDIQEYGYSWAGGAGYGLIQWTNINKYGRVKGNDTLQNGYFTGVAGKRRQNLVNWCNYKGLNYKTAEAQLKFLAVELVNNGWDGYSFAKAVNALTSTEDSASGAYNCGYWFGKVVISGGSSSYGSRAGSWAQTYYNILKG